MNRRNRDSAWLRVKPLGGKPRNSKIITTAKVLPKELKV